MDELGGLGWKQKGIGGQGGRHRGMGELGGLGWNRDTTVVYT